MTDNFCFKCGSTLRPNAKFCSACGIALAEDAAPDKDPFKEVIEDGIEFAKITEGFDFAKARLGVDEEELEENQKLRLARTPEELQTMQSETEPVLTVEPEPIEKDKNHRGG